MKVFLAVGRGEGGVAGRVDNPMADDLGSSGDSGDEFAEEFPMAKTSLDPDDFPLMQLPDLRSIHSLAPSIEEVANLSLNLDEEEWQKAARGGGIIEICVLGKGNMGSVSLCRLRNSRQDFVLRVFPSIGKILMTRRFLRARNSYYSRCHSFDHAIVIVSFDAMRHSSPSVHRFPFAWSIVLEGRSRRSTRG
jgi:hypothetical protein